MEIRTGPAKHRVEIARRVRYQLYVIGAVARRVYNVLSEGKDLRLTDSINARSAPQIGSVR
jgi:hypothetical protein